MSPADPALSAHKALILLDYYYGFAHKSLSCAELQGLWDVWGPPKDRKNIWQAVVDDVSLLVSSWGFPSDGLRGSEFLV